MIHQEQILVVREPAEIVTILGSCVGVALFDKPSGVCGLNHFVLPLWDGSGLATPKYGSVSMEKMIDQMRREGAGLRTIQAKVFGGASMSIADRFAIGERNVKVALEVLGEYNIPILAQDTGGNRGRKLIFNTETIEVKVFYSGEDRCS
jgi:chemotaxis protein CheD